MKTQPGGYVGLVCPQPKGQMFARVSIFTYSVVSMALVRESLHVTVSANTVVVKKTVTRELNEIPFL